LYNGPALYARVNRRAGLYTGDSVPIGVSQCADRPGARPGRAAGRRPGWSVGFALMAARAEQLLWMDRLRRGPSGPRLSAAALPVKGAAAHPSQRRNCVSPGWTSLRPLTASLYGRAVAPQGGGDHTRRPCGAGPTGPCPAFRRPRPVSGSRRLSCGGGWLPC
jgi:hypothetical protein